MTALEKLDPDEILKTSRRLRSRIEERFPGAGLVDVADQLATLAFQARATCRHLRQPDRRLRFVTYGVIAFLAIGAIAGAIVALEIATTTHSLTWTDLVQTLEAGMNDVVLVGAAIWFLVSFEARAKRGKIVRALHELRTVAHLIDVHQLTKSPEAMGAGVTTTASSPARKLTPFELGRYLDYCSEMLSLTGKIAALYGDGTDDAPSIEAVTEVEELTIGLQTKIWQKLLLLHIAPGGSARVPAPERERPTDVVDQGLGQA